MGECNLEYIQQNGQFASQRRISSNTWYAMNGDQKKGLKFEPFFFKLVPSSADSYPNFIILKGVFNMEDNGVRFDVDNSDFD